jgi:hypothetical protein
MANPPSKRGKALRQIGICLVVLPIHNQAPRIRFLLA